ncbi:MAG: flagellar assembly protein FliW [Gemmatimonadales bacterium]|nr:flagellar assembly protein FliW [Gemmatimonadales bacterium]
MPKFRTDQFGELQYQDGDVIHLPDGLVGMPSLQNWLIMEMGDDTPLKWFQSLDRSDFGFPLTQPYLYLDEFEVKLPQSARIRMRNQKDEDIAILIITTVHPGGTMVTGNLLAPLVIDTETRRGVQFTQEDGKYSLRQEINYLKFGLAVKSDSADNTDSEGLASSSEDPSLVEAEATQTVEVS